MKRFTRIACIVAAIAAAAPMRGRQSETTPSVAASSMPQIGIVRTPDDFDGYGCRLQFADDYEKRNARYVLASNSEEEAVMNIDGSDVRLYRTGFEEGFPGDGTRFVDFYRTDEFAVRVDLVVIKKCEPSDENCEITLYDAVIAVTRGTATRTTAAKGFCGA